MFTLIQTKPHVAGFGSSYPTFNAARTYALELRELGLCEQFTIGKYTKDGYKQVYNSEPSEGQDEHNPRHAQR